MPLFGASNAVLTAVAVQSDESQAAPQSNHSPWKLRASASLTADTAMMNVALVTVALSGRMLVSHCTKPLFTANVPPVKLRATPMLAAALKQVLNATLAYAAGVVLAA
jgi:hypothetical protein